MMQSGRSQCSLINHKLAISSFSSGNFPCFNPPGPPGLTLHDVDGDLGVGGVAGAAGVEAGLVGPGEDQGEKAEGGGARPPLHGLDVALQLPAQVQQLQHQEEV